MGGRVRPFESFTSETTEWISIFRTVGLHPKSSSELHLRSNMLSKISTILVKLNKRYQFCQASTLV
jgi:hypothetical protein